MFRLAIVVTTSGGILNKSIKTCTSSKYVFSLRILPSALIEVVQGSSVPQVKLFLSTSKYLLSEAAGFSGSIRLGKLTISDFSSTARHICKKGAQSMETLSYFGVVSIISWSKPAKWAMQTLKSGNSWARLIMFLG